MHECEGRGKKGVLWTVQQFWTGPTGKPWCALQKQTDEGVVWQITGYRHELDGLCTEHGITPDELPPTTEEEFLGRAAGDMPEEPTMRPAGRMTWQPRA